MSLAEEELAKVESSMSCTNGPNMSISTPNIATPSYNMLPNHRNVLDSPTPSVPSSRYGLRNRVVSDQSLVTPVTSNSSKRETDIPLSDLDNFIVDTRNEIETKASAPSPVDVNESVISPLITNVSAPSVLLPCAKCLKDVTGTQCVACDSCERWFHSKCCMQKKTFDKLDKHSEVVWFCKECKVNEKKRSVKTVRSVKWGKLASLDEITSAADSAYTEIVKWTKNMFLVPRGKVGDACITELNRLVNLFNDKTELESVALRLVFIFLPMMLQKPSPNSRAKDHVRVLEKRFNLWRAGDLAAIIREGCVIQHRLEESRKVQEKSLATRFAQLMMHGKVSAATRLINRQSGGLLDVSGPVISQLQDKHPSAKPASEDILITGEKISVENVIFEAIDIELVKKAAKLTSGSGGPTQVDSECWQHILCCSAFKKPQELLADSIARLARRICTEVVDFQSIEVLTAGRLVPLDKCPGLRPIGIGEILRRIIGKCVMMVLKKDVQNDAGPLQTCAGHAGGIEAAIHAMAEVHDDENTEAILLVDASNAFNALNRNAATHNMQYVCPPLARYFENTYREPANLYVANGDGLVIKSCEGFTQGDNIATGGYALSTRPLIDRLRDIIRQVWFADDSAAGGKLKDVYKWWKELLEVGPKYGYYPNPSKSILVVKDPQMMDEAKALFGDFNMQITSGTRHLGAVLGNTEVKEQYVTKKVDEWCKDIKMLADIADSEPQAAYSAYISSIQHRWKFAQRTVPHNILSEAMEPLEHEIRHNLLPKMLGRNISDIEREVLALPIKLGGLGIGKPNEECHLEYTASKLITEELKQAIVNQDRTYTASITLTNTRKELIKKKKNSIQQANYEDIVDRCSTSSKRAMAAAREKGASSWLSALPLQKFGYVLNKEEFRDSVCLRYSWWIPNTPIICGCGKDSDLDHLLSCKLGGYVIMRHNHIRDTEAKFLKEVCFDVKIEPTLQKVNDGDCLNPKTITSDQARLDVSARGLWTPLDKTFLDIRVSHPNCLSNRTKTLEEIHEDNEEEKKDHYNERVLNVEKATLTVAGFLTTGGMSKECLRLNNKIAELIARKRGEKYCDVVRHVRTRLRFAMLRTTLIALRGYRGKHLKKEELPLDEVSYNLIPAPIKE